MFIQLVPAEQLLQPVEKNIIRLTNIERVHHGLSPLVVDFHLLQSARNHTIWMTRMQMLRHTNLPVAENIAVGQRSSQEVVKSWMNSPGHRANILNQTYRKIGAAAYRNANGTIFWCQQFQK
jgi:uncharacterized protein YkwD